MAQNVYANGSASKEIFVKSGGSWVTVKGVWVKDGGVWRQCFPAASSTQSYTTAGTYSFTVPNGIYSLTATIVGGSTGVTEINSSTYAFTNKAVLSSPYGLAVDTGYTHLFAANQSANTVVVYDTSYTILKSICNTTTNGACASSTANADWVFPTGLAYDGSAYIYVTSFSGGNKGLYKIKTSDYSVTSISSTLFNR